VHSYANELKVGHVSKRKRLRGGGELERDYIGGHTTCMAVTRLKFVHGGLVVVVFSTDGSLLD
jgi:hypothetical protein